MRETDSRGNDTLTVNDAAIERVLRRGTAEAIVEKDLERLLRTTDRPLRVKFGIDPSSADLHLGHTVCFRKLKHFQELGHTVVIIIGDWTAQIGDPSGRSATRRMLTAEEVKANAQTYTDQLYRVISPDRTEVRWQSEWFGPFGLADMLRLTSRYTVAQMLAREDFSRRYATGQPIAVVELMYPLLQAYDSIAVQSDVELGGMDQKFNLLVGRDMQIAFGQPPQQVLMVPILVGTDGVQKMSKSLGNAIPVNDAPEEMFAKVMSLNDSVILSYFELVTDVPPVEIAEIKAGLEGGSNPRDAKRRLGQEIVGQFWGREAARAADEEFLRRFSRRELPTDIPERSVNEEWFRQPTRLAEVLVATGLAASMSEARRRIEEGAVRIDEEKFTGTGNSLVSLKDGSIVQVSRRNFVRLKA